jgi:glyoxylase-like metal-dependent hydrolase (beta-lactamase superfamily II)
MIEQVSPGLFRIKVPLPGSPLKYLNSYVIKGERNLVVDTGLNRDECLAAMTEGLAELEVDTANTDFYITHLHADHFALTPKLASPSSRIFFNRPEAEIIEAHTGWEAMIAYGGLNGFPEDELQAALANHPGFKFGSDWVPELSLIDEGQVFAVGDYRFTSLATPGHSRGHTCLWEADKKILIAGDHILDDITPNIQCWWEDDDPLAKYLHNLDRVDALGAELVLPGHRRLVTDCARRVAQLKQHHAERLQEILVILEAGPANAYEVAAKMSWDIKADSWQDFPVAQKWFATGEALAHLRYLENQGSLSRDQQARPMTYALAG